MKVFEVTTEHCENDSKEITTTVQYVTSEEDTLMSVVDHFTRHCYEYEKSLIGVREVLVIVQHIQPAECSFDEYTKFVEAAEELTEEDQKDD